MVEQIEISLPQFKRGFHLITDEVLKNLPKLPEKGIINILIKHTSAAIIINENADPSVRIDLDSFFNRLIPDGTSWFMHNSEGDDDMPAHIKSSILGQSLSIPITNGKAKPWNMARNLPVRVQKPWRDKKTYCYNLLLI